MSSIVEKNGKCWLCSHNYFFKGQFYHFVATLSLFKCWKHWHCLCKSCCDIVLCVIAPVKTCLYTEILIHSYHFHLHKYDLFIFWSSCGVASGPSVVGYLVRPPKAQNTANVYVWEKKKSFQTKVSGKWMKCKYTCMYGAPENASTLKAMLAQK